MFNDFLSLLAQGLLVVAIPVLIIFLAQWLRQRGAELRSRMSAQQQQFMDAAVRMAVQAAEQAGLTGESSGGTAKKVFAVKAAQDYLNRLGVRVDVNMLTTLIESEVYKQFTQPTSVSDTSEARAALLEKAVQAGVLAAEQSGLNATIENLGPQKKRYALSLATKYLQEHGVNVSPALVEGLVEAEVMRQKSPG